LPTYHSPAKINLNLHITGRRGDGYHLIDSHMVFTKWGDTITLTPSEKLSFTVDGDCASMFIGDLKSVNRTSKNLIIQAVYAMADRANRDPQFNINLTKNIPSGAGLGGGSSNAATTMLAINEQWNNPFTTDDLYKIGLTLGAELPVCLYQKTAHVQGIGDIVNPMPLGEIPSNIVIAWPDESLLTKDIFQTYQNNGQEFDLPFGNDLDLIAKNSLQSVAIQLCPDIQGIIMKMKQSDGCIQSKMTGSGSACFGLFDCPNNAKNAAELFQNSTVTTIL
jgi:4-diphosphocytidyl-2-C-methyl-D-erythritol kinase